MRKLIIAISIIVAGCSAQQPLEHKIPAPLPAPRMNACAGIIVGDRCRPLTAGTVGGTTIGNTSEGSVEESGR